MRSAPAPDDSLIAFVEKLEAHGDLREEDRAALLDLPCTLRSAEAGGYIIREGERFIDHAVLVSGYSFRQKLTEDGARQIVSLQLPGEAIACQSLTLEIADHSTQALTACTIACVPRARFLALAQARPAIGGALLAITLIEASILREWLLNNGRREAVARVAHLLCECALRCEAAGLGDPDDFELPLTQEQLGDALSLTPVHVNRMLKQLEARGFYRRIGRRIALPQWAEIQRFAGFSAAYLHLPPPRLRSPDSS